MGAAPHRRLIIQFTDIRHYGGTDHVTFQWKLFESTNVIEMHYAQARSDGSNHSAGIENQDSTVGLSYHFDTSEIANNTTVRYNPPETRYVTTSGSDSSNNCIDPGNPCATIAHAIAQANTGNVINIAGGTYAESVDLDKDVIAILPGSTLDIEGLTIRDGTFIAPSEQLRISGDFVLSGGAFAHNNGEIVFDGSGTQTIDSSSDITFYDLTVNGGTTVVILATSEPTVTGTLTNDGTLQRTEDVNGSSDVTFFNTGGYGGVTLNANDTGDGSKDLGNTTVGVRGNQDCTDVIGETVERCFDISPANTTGRDATITFYFAGSELSGNDCNTLTAYHWNGNSWDALNTGSHACSMEPYSVQATGVSELSPFVLKKEEPDGNPTAVTLADFGATATDGVVLLEWETASEVDLLGFHIYRAETPDGSQTRLNAALIPGQAPGSPVGAVYHFQDKAVSAVPGTYYYWLEDVDVYGVATRHGPVSVQVSPGSQHRFYLPLLQLGNTSGCRR